MFKLYREGLIACFCTTVKMSTAQAGAISYVLVSQVSMVYTGKTCQVGAWILCNSVTLHALAARLSPGTQQELWSGIS